MGSDLIRITLPATERERAFHPTSFWPIMRLTSSNHVLFSSSDLRLQIPDMFHSPLKEI